MKPVIKAKRWWWPPDRKKAAIANKILQYQINKDYQGLVDSFRQKLG